MRESDDAIIEKLKSLYFEELPDEIAATKEALRQQELVNKRLKVGYLLQHAYGEALFPPSPIRDGQPVAKHNEKAPVQRFRAKEQTLSDQSVNSVPKKMPLRKLIASAESHLKTDEERVLEVSARRKKISKGEDRRAIDQLQLEYKSLSASQLATGISDPQRKRIVVRQEHIRQLLERGYRVALNPDQL